MFEAWFFWAVAGVLCIGLEMLIPGFVVFFFGVGALLVALCSLLPFIKETVWLQLLLFIVFSGLSIVFLRKKFKDTFYGSVLEKTEGASDEDGVGETCEVVETASCVVPGRIRFKGTTWTALVSKTASRRDDGSSGAVADIQAGSPARICGRDGLTYIIAPIDLEEDAGAAR